MLCTIQFYVGAAVTIVVCDFGVILVELIFSERRRPRSQFDVLLPIPIPMLEQTE